MVYAISGGKHINVVGAVHDKSKEGTAWDGQWNHEVTQSEFYEHFVGWDDEFQALIRVCLPTPEWERICVNNCQCIRRPIRWALQTLKHLNTFAKERVFLLGDSVRLHRIFWAMCNHITHIGPCHGSSSWRRCSSWYRGDWLITASFILQAHFESTIPRRMLTS